MKKTLVKIPRKLSLRKETVAQLNAQQLQAVAGAVQPASQETCSSSECCITSR
jgi:hypothetical protein